MPSSPFVSIEAVNGVVTKVDGQVSSGPNILFGESHLGFFGDNYAIALSKCANAGYELIDTQTVGDKKIYLMKLIK